MNNFFLQALEDTFGAAGAEHIARRVGRRFGGMAIPLRKRNKSPAQQEFETVLYAAVMEYLAATNDEVNKKFVRFGELTDGGSIYIPTRGTAKKLPPRDSLPPPKKKGGKNREED